MMEVSVTLAGMGRQEGSGSRFGLFKKVRSGARERKDMVVLYIASPVPKHSGRLNAKVLPLILSEMPIEILPIAHSHSLGALMHPL